MRGYSRNFSRTTTLGTIEGVQEMRKMANRKRPAPQCDCVCETRRET
jgi:hypothetical protein